MSETSDGFGEVIRDTCELVRQSAKGRRGMLKVSPEVAQMLDALGGSDQAPAQVSESPVAPDAARSGPRAQSSVGGAPGKVSGKKTDAKPTRKEPSGPRAPAAETPSTSVPKKALAKAPAAQTGPKPSEIVIPPPEEATPEVIEALAALAQEVSSCQKCRLCETRTQTVFGEGHPHASVVFVGEAPGADEDAQGRPFVGRAGGLLTDMIEKGMRIDRADVYICNVLKCRPPGNRDPHPDEKEQCEPYLVKQLELLEPKVICALGAHAAHALLKVDTPIGRLRGKWHFYRGIPLRATYHPAYLLRSPGEKPRAWVDLQALMRLLGGYEQAVQPEAQPREPENLNLFS